MTHGAHVEVCDSADSVDVLIEAELGVECYAKTSQSRRYRNNSAGDIDGRWVIANIGTVVIKCEIQLGIVGVLVLFNAERFDEMRYRGDV